MAEDAQMKFTRVNKMSYVNKDWHVQLSYAKNLSSKDVGVVISYSGKTEEMVKCAKEVKESGAKLISITKNQESPITKLSDYNLYIDSIELDLRSGAMSSRISQLNVIDILYSGYINRLYDKSVENLTNTQIRKE